MEAFSDDSIELEAKRKEDSSWHPCRVSLSSSKDGLIVNFGSQELEDMLLKKEDLLKHLRFRSMPLQAEDCSRIEEGETVLANRKSKSENLFHDAVVEKVDRVRHSKRGCRCTFVIKWLDHNLEGQTLTVPSSSIMRLATKSINTHPIVDTVLKSEKGTGLSSLSPLTILEDNDTKKDLSKLLHKKVEQISMFNVASKKDYLEDIRQRNKVLYKEQALHKPTAESDAFIPAIPHHHNNTRRTTRSKSKQEVDIEAKDQSWANTSIQEESTPKRSHLSPLAARAALASSLLAAKCLDMEFGLAISIPHVSKASHVIAPPQGDGSFKLSSYVPTKVCEDKNKLPEKINYNTEARTFTPESFSAKYVTSEIGNTSAETVNPKFTIRRDQKSIQANFNASSKAAVRLTRSAIQKGAVIPNDCIEIKICSDNNKRRISGNKNRLGQSALCQENENVGIEDRNNSTHIIDLDSSGGNITIPESNLATVRSSTSKRKKASSTQCEGADGDRSDQGQKRKPGYPNMLDRRVSPRTRSQNQGQPAKY